MAEKLKDAEDRLLESLFKSPLLADAGFSARVVRKINRQLWIRRLTLPAAVLIGGVFAYKPVAGLVTALSSLSSLLPADAISMATSSIPHLQTVVLGGILLAVGLVSMRMLEE